MWVNALINGFFSLPPITLELILKCKSFIMVVFCVCVGGPVHIYRWKHDVDTQFPCWYRRTYPTDTKKLMYRSKFDMAGAKLGKTCGCYAIRFFYDLQLQQIWLRNATWVALASLQQCSHNNQFEYETPRDLVMVIRKCMFDESLTKHISLLNRVQCPGDALNVKTRNHVSAFQWHTPYNTWP